MTMPSVMRRDSDGLAIVTLNKPDKLNSLNHEVFERLLEHVEALEGQTDTIGCVVLNGAGRCFSAGHDLAELSPDGAQEAKFAGTVIERLALLPQPLIVAAHGHCYTGALELALAGDVILAAESARFADTHAKWALTPIWGMSQRLPRRIGRARAHEMMMSCRTVEGSEAAAIGLANRCLPDEGFAAAVEAYARSVLANSWFSHRANKRLLIRTDNLSLAEGLRVEAAENEGTGPDMGGPPRCLCRPQALS